MSDERDERDELHQQELREAMERLNDQNRILVGARMLPKNRPLTAEEHAEVRKAFIRHKVLHQTREVAVAKEVGYSPSVISQWRHGNYAGDVDEVTHAVNDWLERDLRRRQASTPKNYVPTWIAETIRTIAFTADKRLRIAAVVAPSGCGKSFVAQALAEEMRGVYLSCDETLTEREFLVSLAEACGVELGRAVTKAAIKRVVVKYLKETRRILFLDEAQQLRKAIGVVRNIYDQCGGVPIVLLGTHDILQMVNDRRDGRGQFSRRCCVRYNVRDEARHGEDPGGNAAGRDLFSKEEVRKFFQMKKIRLSTDGFELAWAMAQLENHGSLGFAESVVEMAIDLHQDVDVLQRYHLIEALDLMLGRESEDVQRKTNQYAEHARKLAASA